MCTEVCGPPELDTLPAGSHLAASLLGHAAKHGVHITLPQGIDEEEIDAAIRYGTHASTNKEAGFIHVELVKQV